MMINLFCIAISLSLLASLPLQAQAAPAKPNIVLILADDLGYADLGCFGATGMKTPNLDQIAKEGVMLTQFYTPACVCTPTRAALMTGCYPKRVDLHRAVLPPESKRGLNPSEITIAELLKRQGYATGCIGKWHLGEAAELLPTAQGFDSYYGMPGPNHGRSDLYRNDQPIKKNAEVRYDEITRDYTREAKAFINANKRRPFFLYFAHSAVHIPLFASAPFRGRSSQGLYGDMVEELDWSCGEVVKALEEAGVLKNTLVLFTSDNGPSGVAAPPLHGGKGSTWEGGCREPLVAQWPGKIPAGTVCREVATVMDLLPTLAALAGGEAPRDRTLDGRDIWPLLAGRESGSPHDIVYFFGRDGELAAIREGGWKLHLVEPSERWAGKLPKEALLDTKPTTTPPWLYDLASDIGETRNVAETHPDVVERLLKKARDFDLKLTSELRPAFGPKEQAVESKGKKKAKGPE